MALTPLFVILSHLSLNYQNADNVIDMFHEFAKFSRIFVLLGYKKQKLAKLDRGNPIDKLSYGPKMAGISGLR